MSTGVDPCPLCGTRLARLVGRTPYSVVWDELEAAHGRPLPPGLRASLTPAPTADMVRCTGCGLDYFTPLNPGDSEFYASLSTDEGYYDVDVKWEFALAADLLGEGDDVLDVGCGDGVFLRTLAGEGSSPRRGRSVGLDLNPWAIEQLRSLGIEAHCGTIAEFASDHPAEFDVVVMFQVIEHLPAVTPPVLAAASCVRPGGRLIVSVPNRDRFRLASHDPWDFPPHHVSRWGPDQLVALGAVSGCAVDEVRVQRRGARELARDGARAAGRLGQVAASRIRRPRPTAVGTPAVGTPAAPAVDPSPRPSLRHLRTDHTMVAVYRPPPRG